MENEEINAKISDLEDKFWDVEEAEMIRDNNIPPRHNIPEVEKWSIEQIERELDSILLSYPENLQANDLKIDILMHKKQYKEANFYADKMLGIYDKLLEANPGDMELLLDKLNVLKTVGRKAEFKTLGKNILNLLDSKLAREPNNIENLLMKATICLIMNDCKTSKKLYQRILELDPANEEAIIMQDLETTHSGFSVSASIIIISIITIAFMVFFYVMFI